MTVDLKLDKWLSFVGDKLDLAASFNVPPERTAVILSVGVIRPDGTTEYPLYLQRFQPPPPPTNPPAPAATPPPFQGSADVSYDAKLFGIHKAFAHIYAYSDSQQIENELTAEVWFIVLPAFLKMPWF